MRFYIILLKLEEQERAKSGSVRVHDDLSSSVWGSHTNGTTGPSFDSGKLDEVKSVSDTENGDDDDDDDDDLWGNGGWEFKFAEAGEPKNKVQSFISERKKTILSLNLADGTSFMYRVFIGI